MTSSPLGWRTLVWRVTDIVAATLCGSGTTRMIFRCRSESTSASRATRLFAGCMQRCPYSSGCHWWLARAIAPLRSTTHDVPGCCRSCSRSPQWQRCFCDVCHIVAVRLRVLLSGGVGFPSASPNLCCHSYDAVGCGRSARQFLQIPLSSTVWLFNVNSCLLATSVNTSSSVSLAISSTLPHCSQIIWW